MADISMCPRDIQCPLKEKCHRYTAPRNEVWQTMFMQEPYDYEKGECEYFWDNAGYRRDESVDS